MRVLWECGAEREILLTTVMRKLAGVTFLSRRAKLGRK